MMQQGNGNNTNSAIYNISKNGLDIVLLSPEGKRIPNIMFLSGYAGNREAKEHIELCVRLKKKAAGICREYESFTAQMTGVAFIYCQSTFNEERDGQFWLYYMETLKKYMREPDKMLSITEKWFTDIEDMFPDVLEQPAIKSGKAWKGIFSFVEKEYVQIRNIPSDLLASLKDENRREYWSGLVMQAELGLDSFKVKADVQEARKPNMIRRSRRELEETCGRFLDAYNIDSIYLYLDRFISGQEHAKMEISRICYEHVVRIANPDLRIRKSNCVMFGPTGSGKTELCRLLREILPIPIEIIDASSITMNGFKGADKEDVMMELFEDCADIEHGIVVMDEFDKLCLPTFTSQGENVSRILQGELLKMIEGAKISKQSGRYFDTTNITFICAGAFEGAFKGEIKRGLGFGGEDFDPFLNKSFVECMEDFGMIPELAGRISTVVELNALTEEDLYGILTEKDSNCIENIQKLYKAAYGIKVNFTEGALREISVRAFRSGLGARALHGIVDNVVHGTRRDEVKRGVLVITKEMVDRLKRW